MSTLALELEKVYWMEWGLVSLLVFHPVRQLWKLAKVVVCWSEKVFAWGIVGKRFDMRSKQKQQVEAGKRAVLPV